jgi:hypothetical protein
MSQNQENNQDQGKEAKKVLSSYEVNVKKLTAVVKGEEGLKPIKRVKKSESERLVEELFKEDREKVFTETKEELKVLLKNYVTLNNSLAEERRKLDNLEIAKKKEFNQAATKLFAKIEGVDDLTKEYFGAFQVAAEAKEESEE